MPAAARLHFRHEQLAAQEHALDVDRHGAVELSIAHGFHRLERQGDAGIVAQHVNRAELRLDRGLDFGPAFRAGDVMVKGDGAMADTLGLGAGIVGVDVCHADPGALFREGFRQPRPDPATAAGNDDDLARNVHVMLSRQNFYDRCVA